MILRKLAMKTEAKSGECESRNRKGRECFRKEQVSGQRWEMCQEV